MDKDIKAQPSPAGQGDALDEVACDLPYLFGRASLEGHEVGQRLAREVQAKMRDALAARQPVGQESIGRVYSTDGVMGIEWRDGMCPPAGAMLYAAPPAQAVDLGQFRMHLDRSKRYLSTCTDNAKGKLIAREIADADRLLALIDSQA